MKMLRYIISLVMCIPMLVFAQLPEVLSYQGVLKDSLGYPVADDMYTFNLSIYEQESGGQAVFNETHDLVTRNGVFEAYLGQLTPLALSTDKQHWLQLQVNGVTLTPRIELTASAYSLLSVNLPDSMVTTEKIASGQLLQSVQGALDSMRILPGNNVTVLTQANELSLQAAGGGNSSPWQLNASDIYHLGQVGVGTANPLEQLDIRGNLFLPSQIGAFAFAGVIHSGDDRFLFGQSASIPEVETMFMGKSAGNFDQAGHSNIGIGAFALSPVGDRDANIAIGHNALAALTTGTNLAFGAHVQSRLESGSSNIAFGSAAGDVFVTGNNSLSIGFGLSASGLNQTVAIGNSAYASGVQSVQIGSGAEVNAHYSTALGVGAESTFQNSIRMGNDEVTVLETAATITAGGFSAKSLFINKPSGLPAIEVVKRRQLGSLISLTGLPPTGSEHLNVATQSNSPVNFNFVRCNEGSDSRFRVSGNGTVFADGNYVGPADFAEMIAVSGGARNVEPGDVMVIDPASERSVQRSSGPNSSLVAGIYSTKPGYVGSERDWDKPAGEESTTYSMADMAAEFDEIPMAIVGIVPCKVSAENGSIRPGDLLVTSSTPGHAMRDNNPKNGTVVGKALEPLDSATGLIRVLVKLQ